MKQMTELSPVVREQAVQRFTLLRPHLENGVPLRVVAEGAGVASRTVQRWLALYHRHGLGGLVRRGREDRGERRVISSRMKEAIEGLALERPPLPLRSIYRQVAQLASLIEEPKPSYWMVREIVQALPAGLVTLAHEGAKAYSDAFDLVHRREAPGPNAIWQADHSELDILVVREGAPPAKPWLTVVLDDYSRAVAGYYLAFEPPSTLRTALALRQAIWRKEDPRWTICGIPEVLYTDNGSDFTSRHIEQVALDLKMRLVFSLPGKPRGRGRIERFFRTVEEMFLSDLEGYLRRSRRNPTLTLAQLEAQFRTFLLDVYHRNASSGTAEAPIKRWEGGGFLPRMPPSLDQLDLLLMQGVRSRRVRPDGIHFERLRYLSPVLAAYVREEVTIRFDPRDMGEIRVFHQDKFLCRAISADLAGETVPLREILRARNQQRRNLRSLLRDRQQAVDTLLEMRRGSVPEEPHVESAQPSQPSTVPLRRYRTD